MIIAFWICLFIIIYTFIGYGLVLFFLVKIKRIFTKPQVFIPVPDDLPNVTLLIAAYNEEDIIADKVNNTLELNYPKDRLQIVFITDGSSDRNKDNL